MANVLIYGDESEFAIDLQNQLKRFVQEIQFTTDVPDVIIIDENVEEYQKLRKKYPNVPIVFLGETIEQKDDALNIILTKPLRLMTLLDVVRAANHKLDHTTDGYLRFNDFELHPSQKEMIDLQDMRQIKLTEREVGILKYLYKNVAEYVSKADLQTNVWQYNEEVATHTVETHIYRLRQKAETKNRRLILTNNGRYKLVMKDKICPK